MEEFLFYETHFLCEITSSLIIFEAITSMEVGIAALIFLKERPCHDIHRLQLFAINMATTKKCVPEEASMVPDSSMNT